MLSGLFPRVFFFLRFYNTLSSSRVLNFQGGINFTFPKILPSTHEIHQPNNTSPPGKLIRNGKFTPPPARRHREVVSVKRHHKSVILARFETPGVRRRPGAKLVYAPLREGENNSPRFSFFFFFLTHGGYKSPAIVFPASIFGLDKLEELSNGRYTRDAALYLCKLSEIAERGIDLCELKEGDDF